MLGSIAPSVAAPEASPSLDPAAAEKAAQQTVKLSDSGPVANIQVLPHPLPHPPHIFYVISLSR